ncbi:MAG: hypothetical protein R3B09_13445 [Nannocystaceae bacterium]
MRRVLSALAALAIGGCVNQDLHLYEVRVHGSITAPSLPDAEGELHVVFHRARAGEGATSHPLGPFDASVLDGPGPLDETILVPTDDGEGLVIYAWLDLDGDGALCAPGGAVEPAGLIEVDKFPRHDVAIDLELGSNCAGPEALYP